MGMTPAEALVKSRAYRDMTATGLYDLDGDTLVRVEMDCYMAAILLVADLLDEAARDLTVPTCTPERLARWEGILGLSPRPRATLDQRRRTVGALLALGPRHGAAGEAANCLAAAGITSAAVEERYLDQRLAVTVRSFDPSFDSVYDCMDRARTLLPAHLEVLFEFGGPDWTRWEEQNSTWAAHDGLDLTWQQRDTGPGG